jgi:hypothetical protein
MRCKVRFLTILLVFIATPALRGQHVIVGGGLGLGTVPRALAPLCSSAQRLDGAGVSARAGAIIGALHASINFDWITTASVAVAECIAQTGVQVDSLFDDAGNSAATLSGSVSLPIGSVLQAGAEAGRVLQHSSWFVGPVIGARFGRFRLEAVARYHSISFEEITTDFGPPTVTELSRESRTENSWGGAVRVLFVSR